MRIISNGLSFLIIFALNTVIMQAQNNNGVNFYETGDYTTSKSYFLEQGVNGAIEHYYLGDIYFKENKLDSARFHFLEGLQIDQDNIHNRIGIAKVEAAETNSIEPIKKIGDERKYRKNGIFQTLVAEAYFDTDHTKEGWSQLEKAIKTDRKNPKTYVLRGDILAIQDKTGDAAASYENAIYFDENYKAGYVKLARLYQNRRTQVALDYLRKVVDIDSSYIPGYLLYSEINYRKGFYADALDGYNKYLSLITPKKHDYELYATILFFNDMYNDAVKAIEKAPDNMVMNRLKTYSLYEMGEYEEALKSATSFFESTEQSNIITQDYTYYGQILDRNKQYAKAAEAYLEAFNRDKDIKNILDAAKAFERAGDYDNAIKYYKYSLEHNPEPSMADYYMLGGACYNAGTDTKSLVDNPDEDKQKKDEYLREADNVFKLMTEHFPDHYLGHLMRARSNFALDPQADEGLAVPYYTKAVEIMLNDVVARKSEILESYRYLGFYHLGKNDVEQSKYFWNKVLEHDPADKTALQVINSLK